ncbi:MAG: cytochrome C [Gammaproteobacteria bacterium]|nr:cytochrome C [Gammaproteobacteria bacterium]MDE2347755.1 cytochrome C [Gammaproteobacteria bacterium]
MRLLRFAALWFCVGCASAAQYPAGRGAAGAAAWPGVPNPQRAWQDWALNCQGCHRADGGGSPATAPKLDGEVAKFLWVPGGREYLARVPGIASSPLSDEAVRQVVNWMLWRFDARDVPANFSPYTAEEIGRLRAHPMRLEMATLRRRLLRRVNAVRNRPAGTAIIDR